MSGDAMRAGAAKALEEVLRRRHPDFAWEVTAPVERAEVDRLAVADPSRRGQVHGLVASLDGAHPIADVPAALANPHDRESAA